MIEFDQNLNPVEPPRPTSSFTPPPAPSATPPFSSPRNGRGLGFIIGVVGIIVIAGALIYAIGNRPSNNNGQPEGLTVNADSTVYATPDIAKVTVGVSKTASTVDAAEKQATDVTQAIKDKLTALGIKDSDIKTVDYSLYPEQVYRSSGISQVTGYHAHHSLEITIRDLNKTTDVLSGATTAGANEIGQVVFTLENSDSKLAEARKDAIQKAKDKAKQMASDGGFRLGRLIAISEYSNTPIPIYGDMGGIGGGSTVKAPTPEPGTYNVQVTVTLTYQIR